LHQYHFCHAGMLHTVPLATLLESADFVIIAFEFQKNGPRNYSTTHIQDYGCPPLSREINGKKSKMSLIHARSFWRVERATDINTVQVLGDY